MAMTRVKAKRVVAVNVNLAVAAAHLFTGPGYRGPFRTFVTGYAIDILLPFAAYFLLILCDEIVPALRRWYLRAAVVVAVMSSAELAQYFGYPVFGNTFDPLDFAAYATGALMAAIADQVLLPRLMPAWLVAEPA